ncbi:P1 family peptidase [Jannaschia sp. Os4]|uniref:P1 family peptidase n=1 Tax=Jannaschia sp. Os4 TaxID=2807617 RepID=UPI0019396F2A|nr:P1 family peptidase [Jannaschia sp. Os4]
MRAGARNAITDVAGLRVGCAHDEGLRSGVTVLMADAPFVAGVHVMGGAPGTRETDLLAPDKLVQEVDALVLAGGSAFGLGAADGVADGLRRMGRGFAVGDVTVPIVPAAILFDLLNGGDKGWDGSPYPALGRAALEAASEDVPSGSHGAGLGATTDGLRGGLGTASAVLSTGHTVGALVAVNALGAAVDGAGRFLAAPLPGDGFAGGGAPDPTAEAAPPGAPGTNTTIAIVATDAALTQAQATRMAVAAHDGLARSLWPAHTPLDGDLVFAAATGARPVADPVGDPMRLGHAAAVTLARAVARGVRAASPPPKGMPPSWAERFGS